MAGVLFFMWLGSFSSLNALLILEIWTLLSFESRITYSTVVITMSAIFSFPYVVAMMRGRRASAQ